MRLSKYLFSAITGAMLAAPLAACSFEGSSDHSALSGKHADGKDGESGECTLTQGYWKNHPANWPVSSLKLGTHTYGKDELIAILKTPVKGNGLIQLAHQLIAAKLNVAAGASDASIKTAIVKADALIGNLEIGVDALPTSKTSPLTDKLDAFNNGKSGPGHCDKQDDGDEDCDHDDDGDCDDDCDHDDDGDCDGDDGDCDHDADGGTCDGDDHDDDCGHDTDGDGHGDCPPPAPACGNGLKEGAEACDDGNTLNGDGCSSTCTIEGPVCGDGVMEGSEGCDDGNTVNGDGCSSTCECEPGVN